MDTASHAVKIDQAKLTHLFTETMEEPGHILQDRLRFGRSLTIAVSLLPFQFFVCYFVFALEVCCPS